MSKYAPLGVYLSDQRVDRVSLSFDEVADIIGDVLPASAYKYGAWWANETNRTHVEAHAWMKAGWKVESFSLIEERVTFVRG